MRQVSVLVAGWINSPHVVAWGDALLELDYEVHLAGEQVGRWPAVADRDRFASVHALDPGVVPGVKDRRLGRGLARVAGRVRPDLIHAHWAPGYGWMAARAGLRPLVTSVWGSDLLAASRRLALRSRRALRASDLILADSAHLAAAARRLAGPGRRVEVIQWGVDIEQLRPDPARRAATRTRLGLGERPTVLSTRALDALYNPLVLLDAVARVRRTIPDVQLVLKHPGAALPPAIGEALRARDLEEATRVVGFVATDELADIYRAADVYVSIPSSDSSPRSVWEALACGTPAIVSDLPWAREALTDGQHALLVPVDADAVGEALERVLTHPEPATALARGGRELVVNTMDRRDQLSRLGGLYAEILA